MVKYIEVSKFNSRKVLNSKMKNNYDENIEFLCKSIASIESAADCKNFLEDLCTASEILEMSRRLKAARLLSEGVIYAEIAATTGLSTATISRVNHCLKYGSDGYHKVLQNMKLEEKRSK